MSKISIIVIVGPTASGKSALAMKLAEEIDAEIISADSMQLYKGMNIGTAKPSAEELALVPHHLIDVADLDEDFTVARFRKEASEAIDDITSRGKQVVVCGGTGLYIRALTQGLCESPAAVAEVRAKLAEIADEEGPKRLHERLKEVDPEGAARIHSNNVRRVIRALEVFELTGRPISALHAEHAFSENPYRCFKIGLEVERSELYRTIEERTDSMIEAGLVEETRALIEAGYSGDLKPMQGLGYKEILRVVAGEDSLDEAKKLIKRNTRHYAKRQMTWFKRDGEIHWFSPNDTSLAIKAAKEFLL